MSFGNKNEDADRKNRQAAEDGLKVSEQPAVYRRALMQKGPYTIDDIYALPDDVYAELIDGWLFYMNSPSWTHQSIIGELHLLIAAHIKSRGGPCQVGLSPLGVYLFADDSTYLLPDLFVLCDREKRQEKGCMGAPDWVIEVASPSTRKRDYMIKLFKYREAGVKEYWIIEPKNRTVSVYRFGGEEELALYSFEEEITCGLYPDLPIRLADMVQG